MATFGPVAGVGITPAFGLGQGRVGQGKAVLQVSHNVWMRVKSRYPKLRCYYTDYLDAQILSVIGPNVDPYCAHVKTYRMNFNTLSVNDH